MADERLIDPFGSNLIAGLAKGQRLSLCEQVRDKGIVMIDRVDIGLIEANGIGVVP